MEGEEATAVLPRVFLRLSNRRNASAKPVRLTQACNL
jgi:hypothetical protein